MDDTIAVSEVRRVINKHMQLYHSEMLRWRNALDARRDEDDHHLNAKLEIDIAINQAAWCALLGIAGDLKIKLDIET